MTMTSFDIEAFREGPGRDALLTLRDAARDYRDDPEFRARLEADPRAELTARELQIMPALELPSSHLLVQLSKT